MTPRAGMRLLQLACALVCAAAAGPVFSAAPEAALDPERQAELVRALHANVARSFVLDKGLPIDAALRSAAGEISAAHLARIDQLTPAWLQEEWRLHAASGAKLNLNEIYFAVWARLLNEQALWQLEPGDADYERATLEVLKTSARVCRSYGDPRFHDFSSRMLRVQAMPEASRAAALANERQLLAHWGQPRAALQPWPDPMPQEAAMQQIKQMQSGGPRPALALVPVLASALLTRKMDYAALTLDAQCGLQQWWLQLSLRQGAAPAAALNAFRYGTMIPTALRFGTMFDTATGDAAAPAADIPPYPKAASRFLVTGTTRLQVELDAAGKPKKASVVLRRIEVPGIRGVRPLAFESIFDAQAVEYAMKRPKYDEAVGKTSTQFEMVWSLPTDAAPSKSGAKP